ncbi:hypothetical protein HDU96_007233 [Phlyctochytrium bullatum]|nr:hypothetical protein HDU96_007233 [Phlyctochytrium bullatum]
MKIGKFLYSLIDPRLKDLDDVRLVTSHHLSPEGLRIYRSCVSLYILVITFVNFFYERDARGKQTYLAFFTNLSWLGLVLYFFTATYNVHVYIRSGYDADRLNGRHPFLRWFFWNVYVLPAVFHYIIPVVYWALLTSELMKNPTFYNYFINLNVHALTGVFMAIEIVLSRVPLFYSQWILPIGGAILFVCYSQLAHIWFSTESQSFWAYAFLDTSKRTWPLWYCGIGLFFFLVCMAVIAIHRARDRRRDRLSLKVIGGRTAVSPAMGAPIGMTGLEARAAGYRKDVERGEP